MSEESPTRLKVQVEILRTLVEELRAENALWRRKEDTLAQELSVVNAENAKYRKALEEIAERIHEWPTAVGAQGIVKIMVANALAETKK